jgi:molybdate transport system ATP-binding protein
MLHAAIVSRLSPSFTIDVTIDAPPGITIVFGASGSGKSTLLKSVAGLLRPDSGTIAIGDRTLFDGARSIAVAPQKRNVGFVFQQLALFPHLTVQQNLEFGLKARPGAFRPAERVGDAASRFRIDHLLLRKPGSISGGERQRVALARALVTEPVVLLLDEPLSALDYPTQSRIMDDLRAWNAARRIPILYVTHAHREVFALGERVIVLDGGRVIATGTPHEVIDLPVHETIAQLAGFENLFTASVVARYPATGVMRCRVAGTDAELEVPIGIADIGASIRLAIRAADILLAGEAPRALSARNILHGTIRSLTDQGTTVAADVDAGAPFVVHVTHGAADSLRLAPGLPIWLVIKTHSCRIVSL